jgi:predicted transposase/invertase (TIGR01784 family)
MTLETETLEHLTGPISYVYIELGKFDNPKYIQKNITEKAREWLHLFKENAIDEEYKNPLVNKAINYVKYIINNKYDQYVLSQIAEQAIINEKDEAMEKGMQQGMQQEKIAIAKKMLLDRFDLESISKYSGLNVQEIAALKRK